MKTLRKTGSILAIGLCLTITTFGYFIWPDNHLGLYPANKSFTDNKEISKIEVMNRLKLKAFAAKDYVSDHGYDAEYCFLIDMRLPSGKNRFFVYNLDEDVIETTGLVTHGKGSEKEPGSLIFSNTPNSNCTSLGRYKIGRSYNGKFGLSYKLMGLDKTNSKAYDRSVVLHSYCGVPNEEIYPASISVSEGCPTVSPDFLTQLKTYIDGSTKPILLWIYY